MADTKPRARRPKRPRIRPLSYRHELKYFLNRADYELLSRRLKAAMEQDKYARINGGEYFIRSLYFDTPWDGALQEKLDGVDDRDKVRIRIYNGKDDVIKLERKHKDNGYIAKQSIALSRQECDALCAGNYSFLLKRPEPFARVMFAEFAAKGLKPVVIVDYMREAYTFPTEDVRVTFDKDIRTAYRGVSLFDFAQPTYPVIDDYAMVMEVKFNAYLPTWIRELIQPVSSVRSAISKYCLCRKFEF